MSSPERQTAASTEPAPPSQDGDEPPVLFSQGTDGPHVDAYRARVRELIADSLWPLVEPAEAERRFPRAAIEAVASGGLIRERWAGEHGDAGKALIFSEELGRAGLGGIGIGLIVQSENVVPILRRFGDSPEAHRWMEAVLDGAAIGCIAASELAAGSDLPSIETTAVAEGDGWRVRGTKAFSSPAGAADFCLVLCKLEGEASFLGPKLGIAVVEKEHFEARQLQTSGCRSLQTCRLTIDGQIPDGHLLARQGLGLHASHWGLTYERFAGAAQALGAAETAIRLATTHLHRRIQFGGSLFEHQALRLRISALAAELLLARNGLYVIAAKWAKPDQTLIREAAAAKAAAAMLSERVVSECAHMFGGAGYLEDETPFPRMLRDMRLARLGGGTNEMMWELYAQGLEVDDELYERMVSIESPPNSD
jgi:alkylation response protein AidB-like acyl-CoA dehydrogenase